MPTLSINPRQPMPSITPQEALLDSLLAASASTIPRVRAIQTMHESDPLSLLYQENAKVAAIFWEWRHKVMTNFFTAIVALFALSGWFYQQQFGRAVAF